MRLIFAIYFLIYANEVFCEDVYNEEDQYSSFNVNNAKDIERHLKTFHLGQENQRLSNELLAKKMDVMQEQLNQLLNKTSTYADGDKQNLPKSCDEALSDNRAKNGVYQIYLPNQPSIEPFYVFCMRDPTTNEAWTIIQRRINGKIDFYRNWKEYQIGFGHLLGEHWLGLDKIHALTNSKPHKLWIELGDFENLTHTAKYDHFAIGNEASKYALNILGEYTGNAGDSLSYHAGQKFSTKDKQNDFSTDESCAETRKGAWWYKYCTESNLNGEYLEGELTKKQKGAGVSWYTWHGKYYSLKYAHMAIRPIK